MVSYIPDRPNLNCVYAEIVSVDFDTRAMWECRRKFLVLLTFGFLTQIWEFDATSLCIVLSPKYSNLNGRRVTESGEVGFFLI